MTDNESVHAQSKSSIFDVLINKSDRAMKFFSHKMWLYVHLTSKYEPTNFMLFLFFFNIKFNVTVGLNSINTVH